MKLEQVKHEFSKLTTSVVSDALDSLGIKDRVTGFSVRSSNNTLIGFAYTVKYDLLDEDKGFQNAGNYIDNVSQGEIILIDNAARDWCTTWGGILTRVSTLRKIGGAVVYGAVRDIEEIESSNLPVYSSHVFMASGKNRVKKVAEKCCVKMGDVLVSHGDLVFGDKNGILFIPKDKIEEVCKRARCIEETEKKIIEAIELGMGLSEARSRFNYARPWDS
ncbi:regulator of RNase E activity RraA [Allofrancisella inopinata]|uniref:Putative 4-hydroxy-4-methyl-2-oxoglutarate aldolase n=1 Tax=Allofrancisella inopinata TaxID=1085647 RepID=A0AAE6YIA8_9GAMM|nr:RraA family protein [Allofrancisella inopinata]QIV96475.1 RraA family protein [Allofrancisella inopinata]TDT68685.1 regulator of RNase E activity RraA [Allofrancisella inopinata]